MAGAAEERVVRAKRVAAAVNFIFAVGKKDFSVKRKLICRECYKEVGKGNEKLKTGNCCLSTEDVEDRKLQRERCVYLYGVEHLDGLML